MCIAVIGGMDRMERHYKSEADKFGIDLKVFNTSVARIASKSKLKNVDAIVIFTNKVSHRVRKEAMQIVRSGKMPVFQYHSCGLCTLRECFDCLGKQTKGEKENG